jgi:hypothetical protein
MPMGRRGEGRSDPAAGRRRGRLARAVNDLTELLEATRRILDQSRQRLAGTTPGGATRRVSLHDPDARPIRKGRLGKPVEFGHKAQVCDNQDGIVLDHDLQPGNPPDAPRLKPAVEPVITRTGRKTPHRHRGPRLRRSHRRGRPARPRHPRRRHSPQRQNHQSPARRRTTTRVPPNREMANRLRRPDQPPQTQLRMGPQHDRQHRRCPNLDRTPSASPQHRQDRRPERITGHVRQPQQPNTNTPKAAALQPTHFFRS